MFTCYPEETWILCPLVYLFLCPFQLLHGFDNTGRLYGPSGQKLVWWPSVTSDQFKTKTKCFVRQYSQEIFIGGKVDGRKTLSENIADNGGLMAAYQVKERERKYMTQRWIRTIFFQGFNSWSNKKDAQERLQKIEAIPLIRTYFISCTIFVPLLKYIGLIKFTRYKQVNWYYGSHP
jgi:hypothetical protein